MGEMTKLTNFLDNKNLSEKELKEARREWFTNRAISDDEYLTGEFELKCKNCNGNRFWQHNSFIVPCICKCQATKLKEERELELKARRAKHFEKLKQASLLGERYKNANFDNLDMNRPQDFIEAVKRCKKFCENWEEVKRGGLGIYLYGDVGTGKSLLTSCIGNSLLLKSVPVLFTNFFEIAKQIKKTFTDSSMTESDFVEKLGTIDLLIIDDIGTEIVVKNGEKTWLQDKIYDIINTRYINKKSTIFSSNESLVDLVEKCGLMKKTVDRIASMSTAKIKLQGTSYRLIEQQASDIPF